MEKVYNSITEARKAISEYRERLYKLEEEFGIDWSYDDESAGQWIVVEYIDENGEKQKLYE